MNANPTPLSYVEAQAGYHRNAEQRKAAQNDFREALREKANSEFQYRKALAVAFTRERNGGKGVGEAEILAKAAAAQYALERDMADAEAKASAARLEQLKDDRATIRHLADWGREES